MDAVLHEKYSARLKSRVLRTVNMNEHRSSTPSFTKLTELNRFSPASIIPVPSFQV